MFVHHGLVIGQSAGMIQQMPDFNPRIGDVHILCYGIVKAQLTGLLQTDDDAGGELLRHRCQFEKIILLEFDARVVVAHAIGFVKQLSPIFGHQHHAAESWFGCHDCVHSIDKGSLRMGNERHQQHKSSNPDEIKNITKIFHISKIIR